MVSTYASYLGVTRDLAKSLERVAKAPVAARETEYYLAHIEKVKSIDDFMSDSRLYRYAMKAFGLEDMAYAKAFMRKALEGGVADSDSFANKLSDSRYRDFVKTFNFAQYGATTTIFDATRKGTADRYNRQVLEETAGAQNEGLRLPLNFERKAKGIVSWYDVLADTALSQVVRTAFGLPDSFASADLERQVEVFSGKFDIKDFQKADKVSGFLKRFTAMHDVANPSANGTASAATLFSSAAFGVSTDLLLTMQRMKI